MSANSRILTLSCLASMLLWGALASQKHLVKLAVAVETTVSCYPLGWVSTLEGEARLVRWGQGDRALENGETICADDRLQLDPSANMTVLCGADRQQRMLPPGVSISASAFCSFVSTCEEPHGGYRRCGRDPDREEPWEDFYILSPRRTALLNGQPLFRWTPIDGEISYTVTVKRIDRIIWQISDVTQTEILYSGPTPLESGSSYTLIVEASEGSRAESRFAILPPTDAGQIAALQHSVGDRVEERLSLVPLYVEKGAIALALDTVETLIERDAQMPLLHFQLGELYRRIDLFSEAERAYLVADELAANTNNLPQQALCQARLGELYRALGNLEEAVDRLDRARDLYERSGDSDRADRVKQLLEQLNSEPVSD